MSIVLWSLFLILLAGCFVALWQRRKFAADQRYTAHAAQALLNRAQPPRAAYDPRLVAELPEPARRFFNFVIEPETPLRNVVEITMQGELSLGTREAPDYMPIRATQVLAAPNGFIWDVNGGMGLIRIAGSDGMVDDRSWTRFWLHRLIPVARQGGDADHLRSAFGRVMAEAAFWSPASLLPGPGVTWSPVDSDTARVTLTHGAQVQSIDIHVNATGQPMWVSMARWSNANPDRTYRLQPFGGEVSDFRNVAGFRVPFQVDGGNFFGTPDYFPFYKVRVLDLHFR